MTETNELTVKNVDLPALPVVDVKRCVDVIGDAIDNLKAKRSQATHMNCDQSVIDEMDRQIREYSAFRLQAWMELGKRSAEMNGASGGDRKSKEFQNSTVRKFDKKTKSDQLAELGIKPQRAHELETLAKHDEVVNQYIEEQLSNGKAPSRRGALRAIKEKQSFIPESDNQTEKEENATPNLPKEVSQRNAQFIREHIGWPRKKLAEELGIHEGSVEYWVHKIRAENDPEAKEKYKRKRMSKEDKELSDRIKKIAEMQKDANREITFEIDDLENEVRRIGLNGADSTKNALIHRSTLLIGENNRRISSVIDEIISAYQKIQEGLLSE